MDEKTDHSSELPKSKRSAEHISAGGWGYHLRWEATGVQSCVLRQSDQIMGNAKSEGKRDEAWPMDCRVVGGLWQRKPT
jgi:hypothetical protein